MFFRSLGSPVQQVSMGLSGILKIDRLDVEIGKF